MGMKVAAVSLMCQDERVFAAMEMAGTPCPYMGKIGNEAAEAWSKNPQERPDYKEYKERLKVQDEKEKEANAILSEVEKNEKKAFIRACKNTKHLSGKYKGIHKSGGTCRGEWKLIQEAKQFEDKSEE